MATKNAKIRVRNWREEDIPGIVECHIAAYPDYAPHKQDNARLYSLQFAAFPEGQFVAELDGRIIGYATSIIVQLDDESEWYSYSEITGASTFSTHKPGGDTLYGADIAVHPDFQNRGVSGKLYVHRKKLLRKYNLKRLLAYGRIPGFSDYAGKMTAEEYVRAVEKGELKDPALSAHLKAGYHVRRVLLDLVGDQSSLDYCTLIEMSNPDFNPDKRRIAASPLKKPVRKVRVCSAQYLMQPVKTWGDFVQNVMFFVDAADEYHCHYLVLPEFFTAQLFSTMPRDMDSRDAMFELSKKTPEYIDLFREQAEKYNLYIIAGTQPVNREDKLYNVSHLFTPGGNFYTQDKLHITPAEREYFGIYPGECLNVFDTALGRIAIQVCYDIEFPETSRLLKRSGTDIIFVPFSTDERKAYNRVRYTAQARAVENVVYVVISGNVGNLHTIKSYLINYGQSAIFSPSDFAFPLDATLGEAEPNTETVVIADLDLSSLKQQKESGSVRPHYDTRPDIYELRARTPVNIIRTD